MNENDDILIPLRRTKTHLTNTTKPTFTPRTFEQSFQPFTDGVTTGFWFYFNNDWHKFIKST